MGLWAKPYGINQRNRSTTGFMALYYHSRLLYLRKPKGSGLFLKPFWLPFLHLGPARVTPRELVYRLVAIVKSLVFGIFFYRYKCSSIDVNVLGEGMEGLIVAALTFIFRFLLFIESSQ
jgi:hypothetical protein